MKMPTKDIILAAISDIQDPEIGLGIVDLGLIYDVIIENPGKVAILMTLTTPACPYGPKLINTVKETVAGLKGVNNVAVELVWDPPWDPGEMASDYAKDVLGIW
jgi:metal-sulfur cluster biosynthetic enzyme